MLERLAVGLERSTPAGVGGFSRFGVNMMAQITFKMGLENEVKNIVKKGGFSVLYPG